MAPGPFRDHNRGSMRTMPERTGSADTLRVQAGVGLVVVALAWSGTHILGQVFSYSSEFPASRWFLGLALLIAAGILVASLLKPIDVKAPFSVRRAAVIALVPLIVLAYSYLEMEFGADWFLLEKVAGWAHPYGHSALGVLVGVGIAAGMSPDR
jgi:hypothetical protein